MCLFTYDLFEVRIYYINTSWCYSLSLSLATYFVELHFVLIITTSEVSRQIWNVMIA